MYRLFISSLVCRNKTKKTERPCYVLSRINILHLNLFTKWRLDSSQLTSKFARLTFRFLEEKLLSPVTFKDDSDCFSRWLHNMAPTIPFRTPYLDTCDSFDQVKMNVQSLIHTNVHSSHVGIFSFGDWDKI